MRQNRLILKNTIMFIVAGTLGALYGDILSDWPSGSSNLEFCPLDGKTMDNDDDFATNWKDSEEVIPSVPKNQLNGPAQTGMAARIMLRQYRA